MSQGDGTECWPQSQADNPHPIPIASDGLLLQPWAL